MVNKLHKTRLQYKETEKYYFIDEPVYRKYKTVKEKTYCEECGQVNGTIEREVGVGLKGFIKKKYKKNVFYYMNKYYEKSFKDNLLALNLFGSTHKESIGEKLSIKKLSDL